MPLGNSWLEQKNLEPRVGVEPTTCRLRKQKNLEPRVGVEPTTCRLRNGRFFSKPFPLSLKRLASFVLFRAHLEDEYATQHATDGRSHFLSFRGRLNCENMPVIPASAVRSNFAAHSAANPKTSLRPQNIAEGHWLGCERYQAQASLFRR